MADEIISTTSPVSTISAAPRSEAASSSAQIAVLAALAATGTLATNILLPSLPQMAGVVAGLKCCGHLGDHGVPGDLRRLANSGAGWARIVGPALAGADGLCGVRRWQCLFRLCQ